MSQDATILLPRVHLPLETHAPELIEMN
jgi:hypothetical protein